MNTTEIIEDIRDVIGEIEDYIDAYRALLALIDHSGADDIGA